ncbi:Phage protein Gp37/Gp68 [Verrucomicrobiia bacterium DG1235]|nr:Phage protein Gp37/Gp68 [Verrucomicrobiae bacterium DG1235]
MVPWDNNNWPNNVWIGTTVENQKWADFRLPILLNLNAKVRFLSCEPLLGEIDITSYNAASDTNKIDWIIAGGESGPHSRPMNPNWVRSLRDQCINEEIAFHFKQWGHWSPHSLLTSTQKKTITIEDTEMTATGKKASGRTLDGRIWDELPSSA